MFGLTRRASAAVMLERLASILMNSATVYIECPRWTSPLGSTELGNEEGY